MQQMKKALEKKEDKPAEPEKAAKDGERHSKPGERYTENELMVRLKFIIGCCLAFTLIGIVFTVLYSIMFVTQPLNAISPIDQKFFELIIPVATFLCGTLSGIMLAGTGKEAAMAGAAAQASAMNGQKSYSTPGSISGTGRMGATSSMNSYASVSPRMQTPPDDNDGGFIAKDTSHMAMDPSQLNEQSDAPMRPTVRRPV
jgi:hypothetical protein